MNAEQVRLIQTSWSQVVPIASQAAELFYSRLFELDPSLRPLFKTDLRAQSVKLVKAIGTVVRNLEQLDSQLPVLRALGRRHVAYGVQESHYDTVGAALLWTLEQGLGATFTPAARAAWAEAYNIMAAVMKDAAVTEQAA